MSLFELSDLISAWFMQLKAFSIKIVELNTKTFYVHHPTQQLRYIR